MAEDGEVAADGSENGLFTGTLKSVWDSVRFRRGYLAFWQELNRRMPEWQNPVLAITGPNREALRTRRPFSLAAQSPTTKEPMIREGLVFHGLRHSHNTWLIGNGIPEVGRARRLGHQIPNKVREIYDHMAPEVETRTLVALQQRWVNALSAQFPNGLHFSAQNPLFALAA